MSEKLDLCLPSRKKKKKDGRTKGALRIGSRQLFQTFTIGAQFALLLPTTENRSAAVFADLQILKKNHKRLTVLSP